MTESLLYVIGEILLYVAAMIMGAYFVYSVFISPSAVQETGRSKVESQGRRFFERRDNERPDRRKTRDGNPPRGIERRAGKRRDSDF